MLTYIALVITTLIGCLGIIFNTERKTGDTAKHFKTLTSIGWLLILLLFSSFIVSSLTIFHDRELSQKKNTNDSIKYEKQILYLNEISSLESENFKNQIQLITSEAKIAKLNAENALLKLNEVSNRALNIQQVVEKAADRIETFELKMTFEYGINQLSTGDSVMSLIESIPKDKYAFYYSFIDNTTKIGVNKSCNTVIDKIVNDGISEVKIKGIPILWVFKKDSTNFDLIEYLFQNEHERLDTLKNFGGKYYWRYFTNKDDRDIVKYKLSTGRLDNGEASKFVVEEVSWFIPNVETDSVKLDWENIYKIGIDPIKKMRFLSDFVNAQYVVYFPSEKQVDGVDFSGLKYIRIKVGEHTFSWNKQKRYKVLKEKYFHDLENKSYFLELTSDF